MSTPNVGRIQDVAERYDGEAMHEAAKFLSSSIANFARIATCLVHLGQHQATVDAACKANSTRKSGKKSTRAASSTRSSGWRRSARCTSSSSLCELEELIGSYE